MTSLAFMMLETPLCPLAALANDRGVVALGFAGHEDPPVEHWLGKRFENVRIEPGEAPAFGPLRAWVAGYFARRVVDARDVPLDLRGTDFELAVWHELLTIPSGKTTTYGAIANKLELGKTGARAVGGAVGRNPVGVLVPCHRVVGANGALTGYGGGLPRKRWLLHHEGALLVP